MTGITTVVITHNEESNLERCLASVRAISSEIVVVDSGSTDRTREIAARHTDRVVVQEWLGYGPQKQFALEQARSPWVLSIDADEEVSPGLQEEILRLDFAREGYYVPRRVWYMGRWIRHGAWQPDLLLRLFRRDRARFTPDRVHESVQLEGTAGRLHGALHHYPYRDVAHHLQKMNEMTSLAAEAMFDRGRRAGWTRLVFQPAWEFARSYVLKGGFLDGPPGLVVAALHAQYSLLKYAKLRERAERDVPR
jgi:glycosyltransferase involved in cell wall biosynthesis